MTTLSVSAATRVLVSPGVSLYGASKAALLQFTRYAAREKTKGKTDTHRTSTRNDSRGSSKANKVGEVV